MTGLKPCPFCGGEAEMLHAVGEWWAICKFCKATTEAHTDKGFAIAAWNARAERTCRIDSTLLIEGEYVPSPYYEYEMECGGGFCWDDSEPPTYCPNCGAKVTKSDQDL